MGAFMNLPYVDESTFIWLVVWLPFFIFPYIGNLIIPIDFHIFQRGGPTTNQSWTKSRRFWTEIGPNHGHVWSKLRWVGPYISSLIFAFSMGTFSNFFFFCRHAWCLGHAFSHGFLQEAPGLDSIGCCRTQAQWSSSQLWHGKSPPGGSPNWDLLNLHENDTPQASPFFVPRARCMVYECT